MAVKNNLGDVLERLERSGSSSTPPPANDTPVVSSSSKASKFKPSLKAVRRMPSLQSFSTPGFGKKTQPASTRTAPRPSAPAPTASSSRDTETIFIEKQSSSPGTKREAFTEPRPIKRAKDINKENTPTSTPTRKNKGKSPIKPVPSSKLFDDDDEEDRPWMKMPLDDSFDSNPFSRIATDFPSLAKPLPKPKSKSTKPNQAGSSDSLPGKLAFNEKLLRENASAIASYKEYQDPDVDIATLEAIRDVLRSRVSDLKDLITALEPADIAAPAFTSPYFKSPTPNVTGISSSSALTPSNPSTKKAQSPEILEIGSDDDDDDDIWNDMEDMPCDDDSDIVEIIDEPPATPQAQGPCTKAPFYAEVMRNLRSVFKLQSFRCNQLEAITATLEGKDVFVLMPTGGGKSLCYQLPAVCQGGKTKGVTVVVSPLLALMKDQVDALKNRGVDVCLWNSDTPQEESTQIQNRLVSNNRPMLLYVTPEKLKSSESTRRLLKRVYGEQGLARFVIDEAHCISTWGKDFREAYRCLDTLRDDYPGIPIIALTATANQNMVDDIIQRLKLKDCAFFTQSFNRPNLNYIVLPKKGKMVDEMATYINREHPRRGGIVYCRSRAKCEDVAKALREKGILAQHYHAGMATQDKEETQRMWQQNSCHVIVATVAFGMGIDKPDVRFVIHHDLPTTFDGYYQQTGRAGRDGNPSDCVLYYSYADFGQNVKLFEKSQQEKPYEISRETLKNQIEEARMIMQYASNEVTCRRVLVLQFFGEKFDPALCKRMCNNCASHALLVEEDLTNEARAAVELVRTLADQNLTTDHCRTIFRGREIGKKGPFGHYPFFGAGKGMSVDLVEQMFGKLLVDDVFEEKSLKNVSGWHAMYLKPGRNMNAFLRQKSFILQCRPKVKALAMDKAAPKRRKATKKSGQHTQHIT